MAEKFKPKFPDLVTMFHNSVEKHADRPLFGVKEGGHYKWLAYKEVGRMVDNFRSALSQLGVGEGDRVAVISNNRVEWAVGAYATYGLGATYVPMYESQLDKEWKFILEDSGAKVALVGNDEIYSRVSEIAGEIESLRHIINFEGKEQDEVSYIHLLKRGSEKKIEPIRPDPGKIATFIYTSGTTGNPKGVMLSHHNITYNISATHAVFPITEEDRSLAFLPWAHVFGGGVELQGMISVGASMGLAESVQTIVDNLPEVKPTILFAVPRIWNRIYDGVNQQILEKPAIIQTIFRKAISAHNKRNEGQSPSLGEKISHFIANILIFSKIRDKFGGRLKYAISGAAALSREVAEFIDALGIEIYEGYGMTETSAASTANYPGHRKLGTVGKPMPGVEIKIDESAPGAHNGEGEIIIYGHGVMQGYHNLPDKTDEVMTEDGGLRSGDLGRIDEDGFLKITGRVKELYKLENGKYVAPAPLEEKLQLSHYLLQVMIYGDDKPYNVALVVPDKQAMKKWAEEREIKYDSFRDLYNRDEVRQLVKAELDKYGAEFKGYERVKDFVLLEDEFSTENNLLTPTLKLKRRNVISKYNDTLEGLYKNDKRVKPPHR